VGVTYRKIESISGASGAGKQQQQRERIQLGERRLTTAGRTGRVSYRVFRGFRATRNVRKTVTSLNSGFFLGPPILITARW